jgi:copper(I)-binding protein
MLTCGLRVSALALLLSVSALAQAGDATIRIEGAWARRAVMLKGDAATAGTGNGAVYVALVNTGRKADALLAAASDAAAAVEIHETYQEGGMSKMRPVSRIELRPGGSVELKPGGYHIMLLNLTRDLKPGEAIQLTLDFEGAGKIPVMAQIR